MMIQNSGVFLNICRDYHVSLEKEPRISWICGKFPNFLNDCWVYPDSDLTLLGIPNTIETGYIKTDI